MKLGDLAATLDCALEGDGDVEIERVSGIQDAGPGDLAAGRCSRCSASSRSRSRSSACS